MSLTISILLFTCITNLSLGLFVLLRNSRIFSNQVFFALSVSVTAWAISNYYTEANISLGLNGLFNRLSYLFGYWGILFIMIFCYSFPKRTFSGVKVAGSVAIAATVMSIFSLTDFVAGHVTRDNQGLHFTVGSLAWVYIIAVLVTLGLGISRLIKNRSQLMGKQRAQINLMILGFTSSVILSLTTSVVVPLIVKDFETAKFGPLLTVSLVGAISYAIIKHGLFDIRRVVARAAGYTMLIGVIAVLYALIVFAITRLLLHGTVSGLSAGSHLVYLFAALFLAFSFDTMKRYVSKVTDRFFYRDSYDSQTFLDSLNQILVSNTDLKTLLTTCTNLIQQNLKSSECGFYIRETDYFDNRIIGNYQTDISSTDVTKIQELSTKLYKKVYSVELSTQEQDNSELNTLLRKNHIELMARLISTVDMGVDGVGYLFLGPKKSGSLYNEQDMRVLEIIANELVIAVENVIRFEEIEQFNVTLQNKINDATKELKSSNVKLLALDEAKDEFISMASHQLRTPLTSVKGYLSMVIDGDVGSLNDEQKQMLNQAYFSSQRMAYLISDLLNVSRLKTGKFIIETSPCDLSQLVQEEVDQLREIAANKQLTLIYKKPNSFPRLTLDETKIRQVVMNYIDNAVHYTPNRGKIMIELENKSKCVEFRVTDNGMGVAKHEQHKLFSKFYRAENAKRSRPDGTGIGLFMAKKAVVAQGGAILFHSVEHKGSMFGFSFPHTLEVKE